MTTANLLRSIPLVLAMLSATATQAAETIIRVGDATVRFDAMRWHASVTETGATLTPQGEAARDLDPADLRVFPNDTPCATLAEQAFSLGHYDVSDIERTPATIGGVAAERFAAHTGCRNATPRGEVMCVKVAGKTYLLEALQMGCGGRNLFSGIDPLAEIAGGISFAPAR
jgi:hypothetical protein